MTSALSYDLPDDYFQVCEWFAACSNDATGNVAHPILGLVPTCQRCADKLGLKFEA